MIRGVWCAVFVSVSCASAVEEASEGQECTDRAELLSQKGMGLMQKVQSITKMEQDPPFDEVSPVPDQSVFENVSTLQLKNGCPSTTLHEYATDAAATAALRASKPTDAAARTATNHFNVLLSFGTRNDAIKVTKGPFTNPKEFEVMQVEEYLQATKDPELREGMQRVLKIVGGHPSFAVDYNVNIYVDSLVLPNYPGGYCLHGNAWPRHAWWREYYQGAMANADVMVFLLNKAWVHSPNCHEELGWAKQHLKATAKVLPVLLDKDSADWYSGKAICGGAKKNAPKEDEALCNQLEVEAASTETYAPVVGLAVKHGWKAAFADAFGGVKAGRLLDQLDLTKGGSSMDKQVLVIGKTVCEILAKQNVHMQCNPTYKNIKI